ncbi:hypothetical protein Dimus_036580 [Dionaea muscipula]
MALIWYFTRSSSWKYLKMMIQRKPVGFFGNLTEQWHQSCRAAAASPSSTSFARNSSTPWSSQHRSCSHHRMMALLSGKRFESTKSEIKLDFQEVDDDGADHQVLLVFGSSIISKCKQSIVYSIPPPFLDFELIKARSISNIIYSCLLLSLI